MPDFLAVLEAAYGVAPYQLQAAIYGSLYVQPSPPVTPSTSSSATATASASTSFIGVAGSASSNLTLILSAALGGVAGVALCCWLCCYFFLFALCCQRRRKDKKEEVTEDELDVKKQGAGAGAGAGTDSDKVAPLFRLDNPLVQTQHCQRHNALIAL